MSHGICTDCYADMSTETGIPVAEFLASLDPPVVLLDAEHTIGMANRAAMELGHGSDTILGQRPGTVFECEHAHLSGGCGRTIHCSGCAIRQAVSHTFLTGEPQLGIPATLRVVRDPELTEIHLVISTARVGGRVMLRIEAPDD